MKFLPVICADGLDDLREVGVAERRRDRRLRLLGLRRLLRGRRAPRQRTRDCKRSQARAVGIVLEDRHGRSLLAFLTVRACELFRLGRELPASGSAAAGRCGPAAASSSPAA